MKVKNKSILSYIRIAFIILLISIGTYLVTEIISLYNTYNKLQQEKLISIIKSKDSDLAALVKYDFKSNINQLVKQLFKEFNIQRIIIKSKDKTYVYGDIKDLNLDYFKMPLIYKNKQIGYIEVYYSTKKNTLTFIKKYLLKVTIFIIILLVIMLLLWYSLYNKFSIFNKFAKKVENINFKKVDEIEFDTNLQEINIIKNSINKLLKQIFSYYKKQQTLILKLNKYKNRLQLSQKISEVFSWEYDYEEEKFEIVDFFNKFFGINTKINNFYKFLEFVHNEDKEILKNAVKQVISTCEEKTVNHKIVSPNNKIYYFRTTIKCIKEKEKKIIIGVSINVTELKKQKEIEYLAYNDVLTGTNNRLGIKNKFDALTKLAIRENKKIAMLYIDIKEFKTINETYGYNRGDKLLIEFSKILKNTIRKSDVLGRINADEFVILLYDIKNKTNVEKIITKIFNQLKNPFNIDGNKIYINAIIGVSFFPDDSLNFEDLLRYADIAVEYAKEKGSHYKFIDDNIKQKIEYTTIILNELKDALKKDNELILYYQPKIDIQNNKVVGVEALIRWNHPQKGLLTPYHFIPYAEKSSLILEIDRYILEYAMKTLIKWKKNRYLKDIVMSINLSTVEFEKEDFISYLNTLLKKYDIETKFFEVEIVESISANDFSNFIRILNEIKQLGISIAIDDFGTGYSSLSYINKLPFDTLKIDQSFIRNIKIDKSNELIVNMITNIAKVLNKKVVAEGVENEEILETVKKFGCHYAQGYYFAKPMKEEELIEYIKNFNQA